MRGNNRETETLSPVILRNITTADRVASFRVSSEILEEFKRKCRELGLKYSYVINLLMASFVYGEVRTPTVNININVNVVNVQHGSKSEEAELARRELQEKFEEFKRAVEAMRRGEFLQGDGYAFRPTERYCRNLARDLLKEILKFERRYGRDREVDSIKREVMRWL